VPAAQRYWLIRGYDGVDTIFKQLVPVGSVRDIKTLLQCLTAKAGLEFEEIVGAHCRKRTRLHNNLLEVSSEGPCPTYYCGTDPHFTALVVSDASKEAP